MTTDFRVQPLTLGEYQTNSYLIYNDSPGDAIVIDAGDKISKLLKEAKKLQLNITHLLLTHGHIDHIAGIEKLTKEFKNLQIYCCAAEKELLENPDQNLSLYTDKYLCVNQISRYLTDGETFELLGTTFTALHTPGHTKGGVCYLTEGKLFSGDTLFAGSYGRFDLPTGNEIELIKSIRDTLFTLPDETIVYPGHGPGTTIAEEKEDNPITSSFYRIP
jgi:glyoxylase-like metal-dependent hydrolase (beta-lactamase superfamily II)